MKRLRTGTFVRDGMGVEVVGETTDSYDRVLSRGIEIFDIDPKKGTPCLFTVSGAMICYSEEWTLNNYIKRIKKKEVKFGIGYVDVSLVGFLFFCI
jgi:hypothetical protein